MKGIRVATSRDGWLPTEFPLGGYGQATNIHLINRPPGWWVIRVPTGTYGSLNPKIHKVIEHEDGTITVSPSIDFSKTKPNGWHGYLEKGIWRSV